MYDDDDDDDLLTDCPYHALFLRYRPLNLLLSCEVVQKGGFGPPI